MRRWKAHRGKVASLSFARDGRLLASVTGSGRDVFVWDAPTGELVRKLEVPSDYPDLAFAVAHDVAFAPDADLVAVARERRVEVLNTTNWSLRHRNEYADFIGVPLRVKFGPGTAPLLASATARRVNLWRLPKKGGGRLKNVGEFPSGERMALAFSPDGGRLCTADGYTAATVWDTNTGKRLVRSKLLRGPVDYNPRNGELAARRLPGPRPVVLPAGDWADPPTPVVIFPPPAAPNDYHLQLRWLPDGKTLLGTTRNGRVEVWEAATGLPVRTFDMGVGKLAAADVSPNGTLAAVGGATGEVVVWDLE